MKRPASPILMLCLTFLLALAACKDGGCGQKKAEIPKTPMARVEQITSKVPAAADTVLVLSDLDEMRSSVENLKTSFPNTGVVDSFQKQFHQKFGLDLLDEKSWKAAGLAADSSVVLVIHRARVLLLTYVEDKQTFEKLLTDKVKATFQIEGVVKNETVGKHKLKVLEEDSNGQIAWMYDGKLAIVSLPATDLKSGLEGGSGKLVVTQVADQQAEGSLWKDPGFQKFKGALVESHPIALYLNPKSAMKNEEMQKELEKSRDAQAILGWVDKNVTFIGAGVSASKEQAKVRGYLGLKEETRKTLEAIKISSDVDWGSFGTEKTLLGIRLAANPTTAYQEILKTMPEDKQRALKRDVKRLGEMMALDVEQDVMGALSGHMGIFFYGVAGNPLGLMRGMNNPAELARSLGLMVVLKFKDAASVDNLVTKVLEASEGRVTMRPFVNLPEDTTFKVLTFTGQEAVGNLFIHGDTVVYATTAFGDEAMHKYLVDGRDDKKLGETPALNLGKEFASKKGFNGVYFNSARAQDNLGPLLAFGGVGEILASIEEAQLELDVDDNGGTALLRIDLTPQAAPAQPAGAGSDTPKGAMEPAKQPAN